MKGIFSGILALSALYGASLLQSGKTETAPCNAGDPTCNRTTDASAPAPCEAGNPGCNRTTDASAPAPCHIGDPGC